MGHIPSGKIGVLYSCEGCSTKDRQVLVDERWPGQAVESWMWAVRDAIAKDHHERFPACTARVSQEVKIPMTGRPNIGGPKVH